MTINVIPCLKDNYAYLVEIPGDNLSSKNILIDAPDFKTVDNFLIENGKKLDFILSTHHHSDHIDGNVELKQKYECKIYGYADERHPIPGIDENLKDENHFYIEKTKIGILRVPGHTSHHIIFHFIDNGVLFSGDTLFSMGCGRLFEGTYVELFGSLNEIKSLPDNTQIYCGHEYSEKNAQFALNVEPENLAIKKRYKEVLALRQQGHPTVPTTLGLEKEINPFLRASTVDEFAKLRQLRDSFSE